MSVGNSLRHPNFNTLENAHGCILLGNCASVNSTSYYYHGLSKCGVEARCGFRGELCFGYYHSDRRVILIFPVPAEFRFAYPSTLFHSFFPSSSKKIPGLSPETLTPVCMCWIIIISCRMKRNRLVKYLFPVGPGSLSAPNFATACLSKFLT